MTRESGWTLFWILALLGALGAFLYWYWSPVVPFRVWPPFAPSTALEVDAGTAADTASAPLVQLAPTAQPTATTVPVLAPHCPPGQPAKFVLGFEQLKARLGETMGEPIECEHVNPDNGDTLQQTTTGLAVYRKHGGVLEFTNGWRHWALRGQELIAWEGDTPPSTPAPESAASSQSAALGAASTVGRGQRVRVSNTDGAGVALRLQPNEESRRPSGLGEGAIAEVRESSDDYIRVRSRDGREGWVPDQYVEPAG